MRKKKKSPFVANPKAAVAFALAIAFAAVIAAPLMGVLAPGAGSSEDVFRSADNAPHSGRPAPAQPTPTWVDEGEAEIDATPGTRKSGPDEEIFGDFSPERVAAAQAPSAPQSTSGGSSNERGKPRITSGAASGAPKIKPPGSGGGQGQLKVIN